MLKKFIDVNDRSTGYGSLDFPLYRYAEVLLDYVECLVETGDWQNPDVETFVLIETRACVFPKYDSWPLPQQEETANSNIKQPTGW